jgi:hypothetical protein
MHHVCFVLIRRGKEGCERNKSPLKILNFVGLFFSEGKMVLRKEHLCNIGSHFDLEEPSYWSYGGLIEKAEH